MRTVHIKLLARSAPTWLRLDLYLAARGYSISAVAKHEASMEALWNVWPCGLLVAPAISSHLGLQALPFRVCS